MNTMSCQGKRSCSVDGWMVDVILLSLDCVTGSHSNVLWFNYKCHKVHDVVLCRESTKQQTIQCGMNEIIEIQSVTLASMFNHPECSVDLIIAIHVLVPECKRSHDSYGKEVYSRCYGEQNCTLDGSMVDQQFTSFNCNPRSSNSTIMWFNYTCYHVNKSSPSVALLPLPETREVRGLEVEIFSPYYPCYIPTSDREYELDCRITPHRRYSGSQITYRVRPKYIVILQNKAHCQDWFTFEHGSAGGQLTRQYCGEIGGDKEWWNHDDIYSSTKNEFHIKYFTTPNAGDGTKFWFIVTAEEHGEAIEVSVTCTGQENIPELIPDLKCSPFPQKLMTTPVTTSSNGGLVGGLIATSVVIVIVVVIAIVLGIKLRRKSDRDKQELTQPTHNSPNEEYAVIPDHLVGTGTGNTDQLPVMYTTPITMAIGPYEEIGPNATNYAGCTSLPDNLHAYVNSVLPDVTEGADADQYEDVTHVKQYETLKKGHNEGTKDVKESKIYTGLEKANRLSKA